MSEAKTNNTTANEKGAILCLRNVAHIAADDLETIGAIMVMLGRYVPQEQVQPEWISWLGRQIETVSEQLELAVRESK